MGKVGARRPLYPAYGREMMRRRQAGDHPDPGELVLVALGFWPKPGSGRHQWPPGRFIVVTDDMPLAKLELRMLAGTVPLVAFDHQRLARARELALLIARVEPLDGWVYALQYVLGVFASVRQPDEWRELTWTHHDYWKPLAHELAAMAGAERDRGALALEPVIDRCRRILGNEHAAA